MFEFPRGEQIHISLERELHVTRWSLVTGEDGHALQQALNIFSEAGRGAHRISRDFDLCRHGEGACACACAYAWSPQR